MSHELDFTRGKGMAYVGETPWHGLGNRLTREASIETWLEESGLDWTVLVAPASYFPAGAKARVDFKNRVVLYRSDSHASLGIVSGSHYKPFQPCEALEFYRDLIRDHGWTLETAGSLKGGTRVWALANVGKSFTVGKSGKSSDEMGSYVLLATGMDGTMATSVRLTSIRVVCKNTLYMALPADGKEKSNADSGVIVVNHRSKFNADAVKEKLGILPEQINEFRTTANALAKRKFTDKDALDYFKTILNVETEEEMTSAESKLKDLMLAYKKGPGAELASAKDTAWGAVNAVTFYTDHVVGKARDTALNKAWFGANARLKAAALKQAMLSAQLIAA